MINIITSVKGLREMSDRLYYIMLTIDYNVVCTEKLITILYITKFIFTNDRYNRY